MAAKKRKAKMSRGVDKWQNACIPPEIILLLGRIRGKRRGILHYLYDTCTTTKSWVPATTRCSRSNGNQLCLSGNSSNSLSASRQKYIHCTTYQIRNVAADPFDAKKKSMEFTSVVGFEGKFYALSLQGALAIIENIDSRPTITDTSTSRAIPSVNSRYFKECLLALDGEIFKFFFIHRKSLDIVDQVEVYRLCLNELKWIKVERLQGKTNFFDWRCSWVNSARIGCRGDCVYFTQGSERGWWIYDMESCCISPASMENED